MTEQIQFLSSVQQIMSTGLSTVSADQSVSALRKAVEASDGDPVPVVDGDDTLVGVVTANDVLHDGPSTAGQLASHPRMTVAPHESAFSVVSRMLSRRVDWVPVLKDRKLVGAISRRVVLSAFGESRYA